MSGPAIQTAKFHVQLDSEYPEGPDVWSASGWGVQDDGFWMSWMT